MRKSGRPGDEIHLGSDDGPSLDPVKDIILDGIDLEGLLGDDIPVVKRKSLLQARAQKKDVRTEKFLDAYIEEIGYTPHLADLCSQANIGLQKIDDKRIGYITIQKGFGTDILAVSTQTGEKITYESAIRRIIDHCLFKGYSNLVIDLSAIQDDLLSPVFALLKETLLPRLYEEREKAKAVHGDISLVLDVRSSVGKSLEPVCKSNGLTRIYLTGEEAVADQDATLITAVLDRAKIFFGSLEQVIIGNVWKTRNPNKAYSPVHDSFEICSTEAAKRIKNESDGYKEYFRNWLKNTTAYLNHPDRRIRSNALVALNSFIGSINERFNGRVELVNKMVQDYIKLAIWKYADPGVRYEAEILRETLLLYNAHKG
ncbi:hypothetical protein J4206_01425 [Candidatus Woesearchaeota archaeon]|nr:hypothetical protein [Candidatus Woesearchaeota archaeon]